MPLPLNMQSTSKSVSTRIGEVTKGTPTKKEYIVGMYRPQTNATASQTNANSFSARPIKHWRKQYGDQNTNQTYNNRYLIHQLEVPGGTTVANYSEPLCDTSNIITYPQHDLGKYVSPTQSALNECNATKLVRSSGNTVLGKKYYQTTQQYLQAKCATFRQKEFNFVKSNETYHTICGNNAFRSNCSSDVSCVTYKPNNCKFHTQGAVSSSSRLLRLKQQTINTAAYNADRDNFYKTGSALSNTLAYSGRTAAPFTTKSITAVCDPNLRAYRKRGRIATVRRHTRFFS